MESVSLGSYTALLLIFKEGFLMANQQMSEIAREARRRARAEWRKNNKDRIAGYEAKYWEKRAREMGLVPEQAAQ